MKNGIYEESDFADVVNDAGDVVGRAPKAWRGTDLLPPGEKIKGGGKSSSSAPADPDPVPAESATREELDKYAVEHAGMTAEQASAFDNKAALHAAIVAAKS
jgi:hypothetical protein